MRKQRFTHIPPNAALWIAVYRDNWEMGTWDADATTSCCENFRHLCDKHYAIEEVYGYERAQMDPAGDLSHDILRHVAISTFVAATGSVRVAVIVRKSIRGNL